MTKELISVIMSVYNEQEYISEAIESVLNQTYDNFEFIIIDDCSTDKTVDIIDKYAKSDSRVVLYQNKSNHGLTKNLNIALKKAKGKYIARMDGDDICLQERFEKQVDYLEKHEDITLVSCQTQTFGDENLIENVISDSEILRCTMLIRPVLAHPGFMFRRSILDEGFEYDESFKQAQDYDFAARLTRKHKISIVTPVLLKYRAHKGQVSSKSMSSQFANADRVRKYLFEELGIELSDIEWDSYHKFICEEKTDDFDTFIENAKIIEMIIVANKRKNIYTYEKLKIALWNQLFLWLIRNKKIFMLIRYKMICSGDKQLKHLFYKQVIKILKRKILY